METITYNDTTLHRWQCGPSTYLARPELGARLMNWNLQMADGSVRDIIHWPEAADYSNFPKVRGGNPILFPFAARTYHKGKIGHWKSPDDTIRPMPQHGFSRGGHFKITEIGEKGFTATLQPDAAAQEAYPYNYTFSVRYVFSELSFRVYFELSNHENQPLLWSAGHHFYFTLPWHSELRREDYRFRIPAKKAFKHTPDGSLQLIKPFSPEGSFGDTDISDTIFSRLNADQAVFGPKGGEEDIGIRILGESSTYSTWNAFVIWTEKPDSPFFCVEPWMGPPNSPEHGKGLHAVNPGESSTFGVEVTLL